MLGWGGTDPAADLGSGHRRERVGGSENGLVVHQGLVGHHRHAAHLTHLGGTWGGERAHLEGLRQEWRPLAAPTHHSVHRHLWCVDGESHGSGSLEGEQGNVSARGTHSSEHARRRERPRHLASPRHANVTADQRLLWAPPLGESDS